MVERADWFSASLLRSSLPPGLPAFGIAEVRK